MPHYKAEDGLDRLADDGGIPDYPPDDSEYEDDEGDEIENV